MKRRPLLRLLALTGIVILSLALMSIHLHKKTVAAAEQCRENNSSTGSKNTQGEVMLWGSLSRHLLSFN